MPNELMDRLRPVWEAADKAFRTDPAYATEMAKDGRPAEAQVDVPVLVGV